jgi:hypothetical protein
VRESISNATLVPEDLIRIDRMIIGSLIVDFTITRNRSSLLPDDVMLSSIFSYDFAGLQGLYREITNSTEAVTMFSAKLTQRNMPKIVPNDICPENCRIAVIAVGSSIAIIILIAWLLWKRSLQSKERAKKETRNWRIDLLRNEPVAAPTARQAGSSNAAAAAWRAEALWHHSRGGPRHYCRDSSYSSYSENSDGTSTTSSGGSHHRGSGSSSFTSASSSCWSSDDSSALYSDFTGSSDDMKGTTVDGGAPRGGVYQTNETAAGADRRERRPLPATTSNVFSHGDDSQRWSEESVFALSSNEAREDALFNPPADDLVEAVLTSRRRWKNAQQRTFESVSQPIEQEEEDLFCGHRRRSSSAIVDVLQIDFFEPEGVPAVNADGDVTPLRQTRSSARRSRSGGGLKSQQGTLAASATPRAVVSEAAPLPLDTNDCVFIDVASTPVPASRAAEPFGTDDEAQPPQVKTPPFPTPPRKKKKPHSHSCDRQLFHVEAAQPGEHERGRRRSSHPADEVVAKSDTTRGRKRSSAQRSSDRFEPFGGDNAEAPPEGEERHRGEDGFVVFPVVEPNSSAMHSMTTAKEEQEEEKCHSPIARLDEEERPSRAGLPSPVPSSTLAAGFYDVEVFDVDGERPLGFTKAGDSSLLCIGMPRGGAGESTADDAFAPSAEIGTTVAPPAWSEDPNVADGEAVAFPPGGYDVVFDSDG